MSRRVYRIPQENNSTYQMLDMEEYRDEFPRPETDGTPMQPPIGYKREEPLHVKIRQMLVSERLRQEAIAAGAETPEEADDFDVDDPDDVNPISLHEASYEAAQALPHAGNRPKPPAPAKDPPSDGPDAKKPAPKADAEPLAEPK